jgi:DNA repair protein RecO (recombination protein O)
MIERATGLVMRTRPLTETSLIVHWLTREAGRIATVAKGARRPKSPFVGKLDLFYLADLSFSRSRRSELHNLREVKLRETHPALRENLISLRQVCYGVALIEQTSETETPIPAMFDLTMGLLQQLLSEGAKPQTIFAFELKLLSELGLQPEIENSRLTAGARQLVAALGEKDWAVVSRLKLEPAQIREIREFLHGFLIFHLGKIPRGRMGALGA